MGFMQSTGTWTTYIQTLIPFAIFSVIVSFHLQAIINAVSFVGRYFKRRSTNLLSQLEEGLPV